MSSEKEETKWLQTLAKQKSYKNQEAMHIRH